MTIVEPLVALQQIARRLTHEELVVAVDSLIADRFGTVIRYELDEVRRRAEQLQGQGASRVRAAVEHARERVWSPRETHLHLMLRRQGYPAPELNHQVLDPATGVVYYVDLAYPAQRIAIEYDGAEHLTDADRVKRDHRKSAALHAEEWTVIRVYAEDLRDPTDLLSRLDHALSVSPRTLAMTSTASADGAVAGASGEGADAGPLGEGATAGASAEVSMVGSPADVENA